jgi:DNA mismatch repair protein MSH4
MRLQSGVSGLLDVARQTFKEATEDVHQHVTDINRVSIIESLISFVNTYESYRAIRDASGNKI